MNCIVIEYGSVYWMCYSAHYVVIDCDLSLKNKGYLLFTLNFAIYQRVQLFVPLQLGASTIPSMSTLRDNATLLHKCHRLKDKSFYIVALTGVFFPMTSSRERILIRLIYEFVII